MEDARAEVVGELDGVLRALDVAGGVLLLARGHVVDRGQVEEVVDVAAQRVARRRVDAEQRRGEVAGDGVDPPVAAEPGGDRLELLGRARAHEHVDVALALEQPLEQMTADEAGRPGHEVRRHEGPLLAGPEAGAYLQRTRTVSARE